jgi:hypothetical protein
MAQALPTFFVNDIAVTALGTRVSTASTNTGMNFGASNAPGVGISTENPDLQESLWPATNGSGDLDTGSWTLLNQQGSSRASQISQVIGGGGNVPREGNFYTTWDETQVLYTESGAASSGGEEGTAPDAVIRYGANPADVNGQPDNDAPVVIGQGATLSVLADGWIEAI